MSKNCEKWSRVLGLLLRQVDLVNRFMSFEYYSADSLATYPSQEREDFDCSMRVSTSTCAIFYHTVFLMD